MEATAPASAQRTRAALEQAAATLGWHLHRQASHAGLLVLDQGGDVPPGQDRLELQMAPVDADRTLIVVETAMTCPLTEQSRRLRATHELLDATLAEVSTRARG